ncbi:putative collagen alpha chain, type IV, partial [Schistosoma mansoni]
FLRII